MYHELATGTLLKRMSSSKAAARSGASETGVVWEQTVLDKLGVLDTKITILDTKITIPDTKVETLRQDVSQLKTESVSVKQQLGGLDGIVKIAVTVNIVAPILAPFTFRYAGGSSDQWPSGSFTPLASLKSELAPAPREKHPIYTVNALMRPRGTCRTRARDAKSYKLPGRSWSELVWLVSFGLVLRPAGAFIRLAI